MTKPVCIVCGVCYGDEHLPWCQRAEKKEIKPDIVSAMFEVDRLTKENADLKEKLEIQAAYGAESEKENGIFAGELLIAIQEREELKLEYEAYQETAIAEAEHSKNAINGMIDDFYASYAKIELERAELKASLMEVTKELKRATNLATRERTWRLEESGCGGDEIMESCDKLIAEIKE